MCTVGSHRTALSGFSKQSTTSDVCNLVFKLSLLTIKWGVNAHYHDPLELHNVSHQHLAPRSSAQCRIPARLAAVGEPGLGKKTPPLRGPGSQLACLADQRGMEELRLGSPPPHTAMVRTWAADSQHP